MHNSLRCPNCCAWCRQEGDESKIYATGEYKIHELEDGKYAECLGCNHIMPIHAWVKHT